MASYVDYQRTLIGRLNHPLDVSTHGNGVRADSAARGFAVSHIVTSFFLAKDFRPSAISANSLPNNTQHMME
jgi:hypothetical protein